MQLLMSYEGLACLGNSIAQIDRMEECTAARIQLNNTQLAHLSALLCLFVRVQPNLWLRVHDESSCT